MLSVVTPVYDTLVVTKMNVEAVLGNTDVPFEFIVVYNHPPYEGVLAYLRGVEGLTILDFGENIGCHEAVNQGFRAAKGDYLCKLDNDTIVPPGWASKMIDALEKVDGLAYVSADLDKDRQPWKSRKEVINGVELEIMEEGYVTFSCVVWPRRYWEELGPLVGLKRFYSGEESKMYELAKSKGYLAAHLPSVVCKHLARTEYTDRLYGDWKLAYIGGKTDLPFERWMRR
jgi:cellulose synthase/poly-beta-1,6-N-acetylglucosamine synthase-like glycosyltransferase